MAEKQKTETTKTAEAETETVYRLKDRNGRDYSTTSEAEAKNRVRTQGYKLISSK